MRRLPNAWFLVPAVVAAAVGGFVGRTVAKVMCTIEPTRFEEGVRGCVGLEIGLAVAVALFAFAGVAVVLTLSFRSLAEWNEAKEAAATEPRGGATAGGEPRSRLVVLGEDEGDVVPAEPE